MKKCEYCGRCRCRTDHECRIRLQQRIDAPLTCALNILAVAKSQPQRKIRRISHSCPYHRGLVPGKIHHNMLGFSQPTVYETSKCFFSYGRLSHLDPQQLPTAWEVRGKPWSSVLLDGLVSKVGVSPLSQCTFNFNTDQRAGRHHHAPRPMAGNTRAGARQSTSTRVLSRHHDLAPDPARRFLHRVHQDRRYRHAVSRPQ